MRATRAVTRVLGVDLGTKRIGIACSDPGRIVASPHSVLERSGSPARDHERIVALAIEREADCIVVGLPVDLRGRIGVAARSVQEESDQLAAAAASRGIAVVLHDERMTTAIAQRALLEGGTSRRARKQAVDKVAAAVLLQSFLDSDAAGPEHG